MLRNSSQLSLLILGSLLLANFIVGCGKLNFASESTEDITLVSTNSRTQLPTADLPDAPGRAEFIHNCIMCHSIGYILMQPPRSRDAWDDVITQMINAYTAPVEDDDRDKILDYLMTIQGVK